MKRKKSNTPVVDKNAAQFMRTAANLARKGKTNKKLHSNPKALKYAQVVQKVNERKGGKNEREKNYKEGIF